MITKHRDNPGRHLPFLEAAKNLDGDLGLLLALWTFLENWGLINFCVNEISEAKPASGAGEDAGLHTSQFHHTANPCE